MTSHAVRLMHADCRPHACRLPLDQCITLNAGFLRSRYRWLVRAGVPRLRARAIVLGLVVTS